MKNPAGTIPASEGPAIAPPPLDPASSAGAIELAPATPISGAAVPAETPPPATVDAAAAETRPVEDRVALDPATVSARIAAIEQTTDGNEEAKAAKGQLLEVYRKILGHLEAEARWKAETEKLSATIEAAPAQLQAIRKDLEKTPENAPPELTDNEPLDRLEKLQTQWEAKLSDLYGRRDQWETTAKARADRLAELPQKLAALRQKIDEDTKKLEATPKSEEELPRANRTLIQARKRAGEAEVRAYAKEMQSFSATTELGSVQRELAARQLTTAQKYVKGLSERVNQRRTEEAQRQEDAARRTAANAHDDLLVFAEGNAKLARRRTELAAEIKEATEDVALSYARLKGVREARTRIEEQIQRSGMNKAIGQSLHQQRKELPDVRQLMRQLRQRQERIGQIQLAMFELETDRARIDDYLVEVREAVASERNPYQRALLEQAGEELIEDRRGFNESLSKDYDSYLKRLLELDTIERVLLTETEQQLDFIDEHVLWLRSGPALGLADLQPALSAASSLFGPGSWANLGTALAQDAAQEPVYPLLALLALGIVLGTRYRQRRCLLEVGELAESHRVVSHLPTLKALAITALLVVPVPAVLTYLAWRVEISGNYSDRSLSLAAGLRATALFWLATEVVRQVCRRRGLAESHFGWPVSTVRRLRGRLRIAQFVAVPIVLVVTLLDHQSNESWNLSLGRLTFLVGMLLLAVGMHGALRRGGLLAESLVRGRESLLARTRALWYPLAVAAPLALAALAAAGYYFTALQLTWQLFATVTLGMGLLLIRDYLLRAVAVAKRRFAMTQIREQRAAVQAAGETGTAVSGDRLATETRSIRDEVARLGEQIRKVIRSALVVAGALALWGIWANVIPALRVFEQVSIWTAANGVAVTLHDALLVIAIVVMTIVAARNVPGLLEITVLQRMPLDAGGRYAVATISRYVITVVGLVLAFERIGIGWGTIQWLVAAMSLGLGFGLQEVFANFVCGLIILFEQPVRVGDIVTVGDVQGRVTRIRIRATTIMDWDRRELLVPNKTFITGALVNWTLSDPITRLVVPVGIAYGSDTEQARTLLLKAAEQSDWVLREPECSALFRGFGASSLDFELRVFIPTRDVWAEVMHDLHTRIDRAFREAGIEIAFPQQDIHVRTFEPSLKTAAAANDQDRARAA